MAERRRLKTSCVPVSFAPSALTEAIREEGAAANEEVTGLRATIDFLAAAERGEADTSGIDELAEASWQKWIAQHERWKASRKAADPARWRLLHGED